MTARILIVDDVPSNTRLMQAKLSAEYYQVVSVRDGYAALETAVEWQPDLILLDVMMPGIDGFECCRRLKDDDRTVHIPVVMVTALGEPDERIQGLEAGADDFLTKPVEYDTLMARVRGLVRLKRLLDEWRVRGETARGLGLAPDRGGMPRVEGAKALVVDDWDLGASVVQAALERDGIVCSRARSIERANALSIAQPFDLIVLSLSMATEDALLLAAALRAADATRDIPLLLLAEQDQRERILRGFDMGANDWLLLPLDETELRVRARNQIRRKFYHDRLRADLGLALEMAVIDPLTGLYNKRYLMRHLHGLLEGGQPRPIAVLMVDVDHFKAVNDDFGHSIGDKALQAVAGALRANTRVFDSVARYGGEEFVVVMPATDPDSAAMAGERLRAAVEALSFTTEAGRACHLTISVGTACSSAGPCTAEALINSADQALYDAKRRGRNQVVNVLAA